MTRTSSLALCLMLAACGGEDASDPSSTGSGAGGNGSGGAGGQVVDGPGAILPCDPGELELADGTCKPPGVPADGCGVGFAHDGDAGCDPILPAAPCTGSELPVLGETQCQPVAACGSGTWDDIPVDATTQYVDASHGGASNGSAAMPWTTIQQAINAAANDAVIAVAAGTYPESLTIAKPVKIWGACPEAITVGSSGGGHAIYIGDAGSGTELHRLGVTGGGNGVTVQGATALLEELHVHDTGYIPINAYTGSTASNLTVRDTLVERGTTVGVSIIGSTLTMEDSVVRNTLATNQGTFGRGFSIESVGAIGSTATLRRVVVQDNVELGVGVLGSTVLIEDSLIEGTVSQPADGFYGYGVGAWLFNGIAPDVTVRRSVVRDHMGCGLCTTDGAMAIEQSTIRDILPVAATQELGFAARIYSAVDNPAERPSMTMIESLADGSYQVGVPIVGGDFLIEHSVIRNVQGRGFDGNFGRGISPEVSYDNLATSAGILRGVVVENTRDVGIFVVGSTVEMDSVLVRGIRSRENDGIFGAGIAYATEVLATMAKATGTMNRVVVEDCRAAGIGIAGADVTATDIIVRDTGPQAANEDFGDGIAVSSYLIITPTPVPTLLNLTRGTIMDNHRAGVSVFGADLTLMDSDVSCNAIDLAGEVVQEQDFTLQDLGGNACACGDAAGECKMLSSGMQPPSALGF